MTSHQILQSDFLDILFDNRNKAYGAYTLRKSYNAEIMKALTISLSAVFLILFFINPSSTLDIAENDDGGIILKDYKIPETPKPKQEPVKPQLPKSIQFKQQEFQNLKITDKPNVAPVATQTQLNEANVSNVTDDGINALPIINSPKGIENGTGSMVKPAESKPQIIAPDKQPQFPGGMQAWLAFLNNNLHAPQDLESGEKRMVNIRFHVDVDGTITNFQIIQSGGTVFDNEVIRVLKRMPKWMPALQAGQPVAVSFTQPVTFVGAEE